jgi:hypothetical protein
MPYIKQEDREILNSIVNMFILFGNTKGKLNYFLFKLCKELAKDNGESYNFYKDFIGELECCQMEIYRKLLSKYEDKKINENGDVE